MLRDIDVVHRVEVFDYGNVMPKISSVLRVRAIPTTSVSTDDNDCWCGFAYWSYSVGAEPDDLLYRPRTVSGPVVNHEVIAVVAVHETQLRTCVLLGVVDTGVFRLKGIRHRHTASFVNRHLQ